MSGFRELPMVTAVPLKETRQGEAIPLIRGLCLCHGPPRKACFTMGGLEAKLSVSKITGPT